MTHQERHPQEVRGRDLPTVQKQDRGREHRGGAWNGQADEVLAVHGAHLYVEASQPQRTACHKDKGRQPSQPAEGSQCPEVHKKSWSEAKRHQVGKGIVFHSKPTGGLGEPGHLPVQDVEETGKENCRGGDFKFPVDRTDDAEKAGEQIGGGKKVRNEVGPAVGFSVPLSEATPPPFPWASFLYFSRHSMVSPA